MGAMKGFAIAALAVVLATMPASAQQGPSAAKNPFEGNDAAIKYGMGLFRARCADCHGVDARGVRSPDLTQVWASGRTDEGLWRTIRYGVANTEMPANPPPRGATEQEIWQILAYLKTLAAPASTDPPRGNAENGERIFRANCASCHMVNARGGRLGPDLSRVGAGRSRDAMVRRIRGAVEDFRAGYEPVTITADNGQAIKGVKKNEDAFSVQVMDTRERIQGYEKDKMKEVKDETVSAMPSFGVDRLSASDLDDVVRYLQTLKGFDPAVK